MGIFKYSDIVSSQELILFELYRLTRFNFISFLPGFRSERHTSLTTYSSHDTQLSLSQHKSLTNSEVNGKSVLVHSQTPHMKRVDHLDSMELLQVLHQSRVTDVSGEPCRVKRVIIGVIRGNRTRNNHLVTQRWYFKHN